MASWPILLFAGQTSDFEVLQADLDWDGRSELILANHDASSMGIGLEFWTIYVFPDSEFRGPQAPLIFGVSEDGVIKRKPANQRWRERRETRGLAKR